MLARAAALCAVLWPLAPAHADNASHYQAAQEFYAEIAEDPAVLSKTVAGLIAKLYPALAKHQAQLEAFALELLQSPAYADVRIGVYVDTLDEEDLRTLTWLMRHETMRRYRDLNIEIVQRNSEALIGLFRDEIPRLQQRILGGKGGSDSSDGARN